MSAIVCGKRSNFFEEFQSSSPSSPPPVSKRIRCSSSSPVRFSPPRSALAAGGSPFSSPLDHLISFFPDMDKQVCLLFFFKSLFSFIVKKSQFLFDFIS